MSDMTHSETDLLIEMAIEARRQAYAPYSKFLVGAAVLTAEETLFTGCNVENASYGLSLCAERVAICQAISAGQRKFTKIVIAATPLASPCGACRQFMAEFGDNITVVSVNADAPTEIKIWTSGDLIPDRFEL